MGALDELRLLVKANGTAWAAYFVLNRLSTAIAGFADARMQARQQLHQLPGINSIERNRVLWDRADWTQRGEQWSPSEEWKSSLVTEVLLRHLPPQAVALEVGPGAGRWSEVLQREAAALILVDISARCLDLCRGRFMGVSNVTYLLVQDPSLDGIADASVDFIWSFDVFVHIAPDDTLRYLREFARVMREGAVAVIHHPGQGRSFGGYRSAVTAESFTAMLKQAGLHFLRQFDSWGADGQFDVRMHRDATTIFERRSTLHDPSA